MIGTKPTPGPWVVERGGELMPPNERLIVAMLGKNENGIQMIRTIGRTYGFAGPDESVANASLIVRAVNCHADLVAALEAYEREREDMEDRAPTYPECIECNLSTGPHKRTCAHHKARAVLSRAQAPTPEASPATGEGEGR